MGSEKMSDFEKNLVTFLRLFQNRPMHLAQYFKENDCFKDNFKENIIKSEKLKQLSKNQESSEMPSVYFFNFKEMLKFFDNISQEFDFSSIKNDKISEELNLKLESLLSEERYEDAIKIRDYMIKNGIKRKN
jgi:hypothetical protein